MVWRFLVHWTGSDYGAPYGRFVPYDFLSGIFGGSAFLAGAWAILRKNNCHVKRCWRIGRHPVEGTTFVVCRKHHPEDKPTAADIRARWHLHLGSRPGKGRHDTRSGREPALGRPARLADLPRLRGVRAGRARVSGEAGPLVGACCHAARGRAAAVGRDRDHLRLRGAPGNRPRKNERVSDHLCDLCQLPATRLEIDHEHGTDRIRGLVCRRCNFLLGVASDDPGLLAAAVAYLADPPRDGSYREAVNRRHNAWSASPDQRAKRNERNRRWRATHRKVNGQWVLVT